MAFRESHLCGMHHYTLAKTTALQTGTRQPAQARQRELTAQAGLYAWQADQPFLAALGAWIASPRASISTYWAIRLLRVCGRLASLTR